MTTDEFLLKARKAVCAYMNEHYKGIYHPEDFQVVWMTHLMGDKKTILYLPGGSGIFEVTYDMKSDALYVDVYEKKAHKTIEACHQPVKDAKAKDVYDNSFNSLAEDIFKMIFDLKRDKNEHIPTQDITKSIDITL